MPASGLDGARPSHAEQADDEGNEGVSQIPGVQAKSETLISRRVRETRIGLAEAGCRIGVGRVSSNGRL